MILKHCRRLHIRPWSYAFWGDQAVLSVEAYEVGHRSDKRGVNLICDALPFGRLWYLDAAAAVGC